MGRECRGDWSRWDVAVEEKSMQETASPIWHPASLRTMSGAWGIGRGVWLLVD